MTLEQAAQNLEAQWTVGSSDHKRISIDHFVAGDLMSDILTVDRDRFVLLTALPSDQTARTAHMVGALAIVLVNGKLPQPGLRDLCTELEIPLLCSPLPLFEACCRVGLVHKGP